MRIDHGAAMTDLRLGLQLGTFRAGPSAGSRTSSRRRISGSARHRWPKTVPGLAHDRFLDGHNADAATATASAPVEQVARGGPRAALADDLAGL